MTRSLKSSSDNFSIWFLFILVFVDYLSLVLDKMGDFLLYPGYWGSLIVFYCCVLEILGIMLGGTWSYLILFWQAAIMFRLSIQVRVYFCGLSSSGSSVFWCCQASCSVSASATCGDRRYFPIYLLSLGEPLGVGVGSRPWVWLCHWLKDRETLLRCLVVEWHLGHPGTSSPPFVDEWDCSPMAWLWSGVREVLGQDLL